MRFPVKSPQAFLLAVVVLLLFTWAAKPDRTPREAGPFDPPSQVKIEEPFELKAPDGFRITALDEYTMTAMVMSRKRYWFDTAARVSRLDLLLGWGAVTVEPNLSAISYSQDSRWGTSRFRFEEITITPRQINLNTANTHIIPEPGNRAVRRTVFGARRGDVLSLSGYLVRVDGPEGWLWESSRTRRDFGGRACEIFYVTEAR